MRPFEKWRLHMFFVFCGWQQQQQRWPHLLSSRLKNEGRVRKHGIRSPETRIMCMGGWFDGNLLLPPPAASCTETPTLQIK